MMAKLELFSTKKLVLCVLLLQGPATVVSLTTLSSRLRAFSRPNLADKQSILLRYHQQVRKCVRKPATSAFAAAPSSGEEEPFASTFPSAQKDVSRRETRIQRLIKGLREEEWAEAESTGSTLLQENQVPSYKSMMIFISSTILIWLSEPLLSLVDTTIVGQYAKKNAVVQLAALGPATLLIDSAIYLTYFLAIATTNTIANALASKDYHELQRSSSQVLGLATILGGAITFSIFGFGEPLVQWAAGGSSSPALTKMAMEYCKIRSAVAPMAILGMVAQSICLASLDTFTPALAVAVASLVNVVGDLALVPKWGIQGAGAATAAASVASTMVLLNQVYRKMRTWQELGYQTLTNGNAQISTVINGAPVLGYADSTKVKKYVPSKIPFLSLPDPTALLQLMKMAGPIFFCIVGKIMCYSAMTLRVTDFGVTALAAHNIMMRVFFFFSTFGDAVSQASQTFLPSVLKSGRKNALKLVQRLGVLATLIGVFNNCMFHINLTRLGHHFTREMPILELMANHADWAGWSLLMHPFIMLFEGSILATQDVLYLTGSYAVTMACHFSNLRFSAKTFGGVWHALFLFQVFRFSQFLWRVSKTLSTEQAEAETPSSTEGVVSSAPLDTV